MELILSWAMLATVIYCLYTGFPINWLRKNGYTKYRIVFSTKRDSAGEYLLQESCAGIIWRDCQFNPKYWDDSSHNGQGQWLEDCRSRNLDAVRNYKIWAEAMAMSLQQERKRKKVTKVIE